MKKIAVIAVYFGKFPKHHDLFVESLKYNKTIDFKIFTDQNMVSKTKNLEYIKISMDRLNKLVKKNLGEDYAINYPYKCCDFKPVYGIIFKDYLKEYDFWGHCDLDLIFGDIRKFITDDILNRYDKILPLGHLSLYRNTDEVNNRYKDDGASCGNYKAVFSNDRNYAFDEWKGIMEIYYKHSYPFYDKRVFADISILRKRFTLALDDKNYKHQLFYWEDGHVYRAFEKDGKIERDEFIYIHFKQRKNLDNILSREEFDSFYISEYGFLYKEKGLPSKKDIKKYNKYRGLLFELLETSFSNMKIKIKKIKKKVLR